MSDKSIVTMAVLNEAYQDLYKRVIAIDSPWNILGDKTWTEFWSLKASTKGDTWNISDISGMPSSIKDVKVGSNLTCLQTYSEVILTVDNWRTYWMATSGINDIANDNKAGLLRTRPSSADTAGSTTAATVTRGLHLNSNNQGYVEIPMATTASYGLVDVNAQSFAGDKTFTGSVEVKGTLKTTTPIEGVAKTIAVNPTSDTSTPARTAAMSLVGTIIDKTVGTVYNIPATIQAQTTGLKLSGGVTTKTLTLSDNATIKAPLTVNGTVNIGTTSKTTTITSTTANGSLNIEDGNIIKNSSVTNASIVDTSINHAAINGNNKGITINNSYGSTTGTAAVLNVKNTATLSDVTITGNAGLTISNGHTSSTTSSLSIKGSNSLNGINLGNANVQNIKITGSSTAVTIADVPTSGDPRYTTTAAGKISLDGKTGLTISNGTTNTTASLTVTGSNSVNGLSATKTALSGGTGGLTITNNTSSSGAGTLNIAGSNSINTLSATSTTLSGNKGLTVNGSATRAGTINIIGTTVNIGTDNKTTTITSSTTNGSLNIEGTNAVKGGTGLTISNGTTNASVSLTLTGSNSLSTVSASSVTVAGNKGLTVNGSATRAGTINIIGTTVNIGSDNRTTTITSSEANGSLNIEGTNSIKATTLAGSTGGLTITNSTTNNGAGSLSVVGSNTISGSSLTTVTSSNVTLTGNAGLTISNGHASSTTSSLSVKGSNSLTSAKVSSASVSSATVNNATIQGYTKGITIANGNSSTNSGNAASLTVTNTNTITSVTANNVTLTGSTGGLTITNNTSSSGAGTLNIAGINSINTLSATSTTLSGNKGITINGNATQASTVNVNGTTVSLGTAGRTTTITSSAANGSLDVNNSVTLTGGKGLTIKNSDSTTNTSVLDVKGPGTATLAAGAKGLTITSDSSTTAASITLTGVAVDINNKINVDGNVDIDAALTVKKALTVGTTDTGAVNIKSGGANATTIIGPNNGTINLPANSATAGYALVQSTAGTSTWLKYTDANTGQALVQRDVNGNFTAGTITATLSGTATNATNIGISSTTSTIYVVGVGSASGNNAAKVDTSVSIKNGTLVATKVTNAVWNDLVDCIEVPEDTYLEYGYAYGFDGKEYKKTAKMADSSYIGIHSDTYGMAMGSKEGKRVLNVAVAGFVLAYVDRVYKVGTPLTTSPNGELTRARFLTRILHPERVVATFWKPEPSLRWGDEDNKIEVNGRNWVKIK